MKYDIHEIISAAAELLAAIERRWEGETDRKRDAAISPRQQEAMDRLASLIEAHRRE